MAKKNSKKSVPKVDWRNVAELMLTSRAMDEKEETELVPNKQVLYQFSARGHELGQILLGKLLTNKNDAASAYYRSRPLLLTLGLDLEDAMAAPMGKSGSYSNGRDIGVVCNMPFAETPKVLPMAGDVGAQYTPAIGWAQAIEYRRKILKEKEYEGAIAVILGGDASVATNGFWSALTIATTQNLPVLFYIEDNGYGISVTSEFQTPGGVITDNLQSFKNLRIFEGDGTNPEEAATLMEEAVNSVRDRKGPTMIRLKVPRLNGHSYQDNQAYKPEELVEEEKKQDPLIKLQEYLVPETLTKRVWANLEKKAKETIDETAIAALARPEPDPTETEKHAFAEELQTIGGLAVGGHIFPQESEEAKPEKQRINIVEAIRRTLAYELETNEKLLVFGEDVGLKGGVHAATMDLQSKFGEDRVFDTSLSEEGIIGRSVGMAYAGLMPVAEIQFRKYSDPATEQLNNCGTTRWRTANRFAAPMVVRMPGGFAKCGDPWHSMSNEVFFTHAIGWQVAMPSNAQDAVGLLRSAMRSNNPTIFFEHRNLLDAKYARKPYPGDEFVVPFGKAKLLSEGNEVTIITWGAMCERVEKAVEELGVSADILDLRTLMPWDKEACLKSVEKTNKCLIVHEDNKTAGFGAEIASVVSKEGFKNLDAPVERLTMPDIPVPYNVGLMESVLPTVDKIKERLKFLSEY